MGQVVTPQTTIVTVPGWSGSGPDHWQSIWEREHPEYRRVELRDWRSVQRTHWVLGLERALAAVPGEVVLAAHSLGCLTVVWWAALNGRRSSQVRGAMLVAPPSLTSSCCLLPALASFGPVPVVPLPFPSLVVASENDPYASLEEAADMASAWGSELHNAGLAGHINTASGHGAWSEGQQCLTQFAGGLRAAQAFGA
jgi:predicted alpha/beta hydrolase family esterase